MIVHSIDRYSLPPTKKEEKPKFVAGSFEHKKHILERTYNSVKDDKSYQMGEEWYAKGNGVGTIIDLTNDINLVDWEGLKVKFIELWFHKLNRSALHHPSELSRKGRK